SNNDTFLIIVLSFSISLWQSYQNTPLGWDNGMFNCDNWNKHTFIIYTTISTINNNGKCTSIL
ncbi:MAG TPA: hypothetical protein VE593_08535, partial [Nitrososphaeraceae archaeon]|nr:hypothetical protein [Nitrososphaeraceae archaeon]